MLETSQQINEIGAALAKAQAAIEKAVKDSKNPHFNSKYADLASVSDACRPALNEAGIAVVQAPYDDGDKIGVVTMLVHSSGQWMRNKLSVRPSKADAQAAGSAITYLRRYSLAAMAGVAPEDDDGNAASAPAAAPERKQQAAKPAPNATPPDKQIVDAALAAIGACQSVDNLNQLWTASVHEWQALVSANKLTRAGYDHIVKAARDRKAELAAPQPDPDDPTQPPF